MRRETLSIRQAKMRKRYSGAAKQENNNSKPDSADDVERGNQITIHQRRSEQLLNSVGERYFSPEMVALKYSVSYSTARRWIKKIFGDDIRMTPRNRGRGKRPYRLRRVPRSLLEKYIDEFING